MAYHQGTNVDVFNGLKSFQEAQENARAFRGLYSTNGELSKASWSRRYFESNRVHILKNPKKRKPYPWCRGIVSKMETFDGKTPQNPRAKKAMTDKRKKENPKNHLLGFKTDFKTMTRIKDEAKRKGVSVSQHLNDKLKPWKRFKSNSRTVNTSSSWRRQTSSTRHQATWHGWRLQSVLHWHRHCWRG